MDGPCGLFVEGYDALIEVLEGVQRKLRVGIGVASRLRRVQLDIVLSAVYRCAGEGRKLGGEVPNRPVDKVRRFVHDDRRLKEYAFAA